MGSNGLHVAPLAERELSPQALSDDLIFSYYAKGCMEGCMRDCIIGYFPLAERELSPQAHTSPRRHLPEERGHRRLHVEPRPHLVLAKAVNREQTLVPVACRCLSLLGASCEL
jgi:hypothetical protein